MDLININKNYENFVRLSKDIILLGKVSKDISKFQKMPVLTIEAINNISRFSTELNKSLILSQQFKSALSNPILSIPKPIKIAPAIKKLVTFLQKNGNNPEVLSLLDKAGLDDKYLSDITENDVDEFISQARSLLEQEFTPEEKQVISNFINGIPINGKALSKKLFSVIGILITIWELLNIYCSFSGVEIQTLFGLESSYENQIIQYCGELPPKFEDQYLIRETVKNSVNVRMAGNKKAKLITQLASGTRFCLLEQPKSSRQWLKILIKIEGEPTTGYIWSDYTKIVNQ